MSWFNGDTLLQAFDSLEKRKLDDRKSFRMPVQDVYKFSEERDDRRIIAGRIESGSIKKGDNVIFLPSNKNSKIKSIEQFNSGEIKEETEGRSIGVTLEKQIYVNRGEMMCKENEKLPEISHLLKTKIFWMGNKPMIKEKTYKLKLATKEVPVTIKKIERVMNASTLVEEERDKVEKHEISDCILECQSPIAFDLFKNLKNTGRFVLVEDYNISGGGIIIERVEDMFEEVRENVYLRERKWYASSISPEERALRYNQKPKFLLLTGPSSIEKKETARILEKELFHFGKKVYYLGIGNLLRGLDNDVDKEKRKEHLRRLGEVAHLMMDAGLLVIATASDLDNEELRLLQTINTKEGMLIVNEGENKINKNLINLELDPRDEEEEKAKKIVDLLKSEKIIFSL